MRADFSRGDRVKAVCGCCPDVVGEVVYVDDYELVHVRDDDSGDEYTYAPKHLERIVPPRFLNEECRPRTGALKP
jgi:hypothetical protein